MHPSACLPTLAPGPVGAIKRTGSTVRLRRWRAAWVTLGTSLALIDTAVAAADIDPALLGCWRAERVEQTLADGSRWTDVGGCTLEFLPERIVSACVLRPGNQPITYTWQVTQPGTYRARITAHPTQPQAVGSERDYRYAVDGDRLYITTYPQTAQPALMSRAIRVESTSVKVGSATDLADPDPTGKAGCQGPLADRTRPVDAPSRTAALR